MSSKVGLMTRLIITILLLALFFLLLFLWQTPQWGVPALGSAAKAAVGLTSLRAKSPRRNGEQRSPRLPTSVSLCLVLSAFYGDNSIVSTKRTLSRSSVAPAKSELATRTRQNLCARSKVIERRYLHARAGRQETLQKPVRS